MEGIMLVIILIAGLAIGGFIGYYFRKLFAVRQVDSAERKAEALISEAKNRQKEILLEAKDKALATLDEAKKETEERRNEIKHLQDRMEKREAAFDQKLLELENKEQNLRDKIAKAEEIKEEIIKIKETQLAKLEKISGLTQEEAKRVLLENVELRIKGDLVERVKKLEAESSDFIEEKTRNLLSTVIQRCAASHAAETTTTVVNLPNDEMKGRIIGREGRNIKTIEQLTGVEIVVDDTPEAILVSGFSPIRRHLAKRTLDKLIADGRIHPGRIEQAVEEAKKELALDIKEAGEDAVREIGIAGLDPKLIQILGRLKYRTSYGQNQLKHALEVAHLSGLLAAELGADVSLAKKGGLFHDIGKAVDHEVQGGHPQIGYDILKKFGLPEELAYIALGHHEDAPSSLECIIVKVADAISGSRRGARKDSYEDYLQRLDELEALANSFEGVEKTFAIQAGREVRVFVSPDEIDDWQATKLARDIADKIEAELKYPGEIKVNVIREKRITEYAR
ncbi:MAG: Ribonuclease Y [Parcubacteria group bacterium GW2011_GWA2_43_17]|nr:MAG: Ribonuclease Y [Parcubacteria group bacterium GW2011_GWA2_43_17]KKT94360.1 MAG: Ribonuclease Y [Parcubacteria group bacterium GW2011_GWF2_45_11]KKT98720.1 MAG: Ribonuclease Y [Parcubacteria group bacterium GW2011_GWC2_45_15]OGY93619.1 MAG: ribonuclease Y [Candidatus Komeilibacteria bacterium RIFOXYA2_FULL_45_9]OGY94573.1 MAG: ribonuclease Y [Candidatus Komeilibacteria bacterium RIFOXYC2_FULL_45_12]HAH04077.1 ribonuclease Y [Candidatus Komeilibacteria bacterium]